MSVSMYLQWFAANFSTPKKAREASLPEFPRTREWLQKAEVTLSGVDENGLVGRLTGAMRLVGDETGKEYKVMIETTDSGQKECAFYAREQRAECELLIHGRERVCIYAHMD